jgi:hypothetical protein
VTLHDEWLLTGHCSNTFALREVGEGVWRVPQAWHVLGVERDGTRHNLLNKSRIYQRSRLIVCSPSGWLLDRAARSVLSLSMVDQQVISPGVDQSVFHPGDREQSRREVGISPEETVLLYLANNLRDNHSKDFTTIEQALSSSPLARQRRLLCW